MSKVLVNEVPDNCYHCEFTYEDSYLADRCQFHCERVGDCREERHEKCPLKSVDGLIEGLTSHKWDKDEGSKAIYNSAIDDAITYIKEYCEVEK